MARWLKDLKFGLRLLARQPASTALIVGMLGLGVGANVAIFSFVSSAIVHSLPFEEPERLVTIFGTVRTDSVELRGASYPDYLDWAEQSQSFESITVGTGGTALLAVGDQVERLVAEHMTPEYFGIFGKEAMLGRSFSHEEDQLPEGARVVVISHRLWRSRFGSDPEILGKILRVNGQALTVIGVMELGFRGFENDVDLWTPLTTITVLSPNRRAEIFESRGARWLQLFARLAPEVTLEEAQAELDVICRRLEEAYPDSNESRGAQVLDLEEYLLEDFQDNLWLLWGAVGLILFIVCANVINLLVIRMIQRRKEIAIRSSMGADASRLMAQSFIEALILAFLAGGLGTLLGNWGIRTLMVVSPIELPAYTTAEISTTVLGFTFLLSLVLAVVLGVLPILRLLRVDLVNELKDTTGASTGTSWVGKLQDALVTLEVVLSVVVLVAALLIVRSFQSERATDPGFDSEKLLAMRLELPASEYSREEAMAFSRQLTERVGALPGISSVALGSDLPLFGGSRATMIQIDDLLDDNPEHRVRVYHHRVSPTFFKTLGVTLLKGRLFTEVFEEGALGEVIISEGLAETGWPGEEPLGKGIRLGRGVPFMVVGVVSAMRYRSLVPDSDGTSEDPDIFLPLFESTPRRLGLVARSKMEAKDLTGVLREELKAFAPGVPLYDITTMEEVLREQLSLGRFTSFLFTVFGVLAFLFAALGLYGVVTHSVDRRLREIAIRMAFGAGKGDILRLVLTRGLFATVVGLLLGVPASIAFNRIVANSLFEIGVADASTFAAVLATLFAVSFLACYIPAIRAVKVEPTAVLKYE